MRLFTSLILVLCASLHFAKTQPPQHAHEINLQSHNSSASLDTLLSFHFAGMRGLLQGFYSSLHRDPSFKVHDTCLAQASVQNVEIIVKASREKNIEQVFPAITASYLLLYMLDKSCNLEEIIYEITVWCLNGNCSLGTLLQNSLSTLFQITGSINHIAENFVNGEKVDVAHPPTNFIKWESFGKSVGEIFRNVINFQQIVTK